MQIGAYPTRIWVDAVNVSGYGVDYGIGEIKFTMRQVLSSVKVLYKPTLAVAFRISRPQCQCKVILLRKVLKNLDSSEFNKVDAGKVADTKGPPPR